MIIKPLADVRVWEKLGMVYSSSSNPPWGETHALVPTFGGVQGNVARIYVSFLDSAFRGRIGWLDLDFSHGEVHVLARSDQPIVEIAPTGFASDGVGMGDVKVLDGTTYLFYVGFRRHDDVKFRAFSDIMTLHGDRTHYPPIRPAFDSSRMGGSTIVGVHSVIRHQGLWFVFFARGHDFILLDGVEKPTYETCLAVGPSFDQLDVLASPIVSRDAARYRVGRPRVYRTPQGFEMMVTVGTILGSYYPEVYRSDDLLTWRHSEPFPIPLGAPDEFDSEQLCYPDRFSVNGIEYIVYNGNNMGLLGLGLARGR